jgi:cytochrome c
MKRFFPSRRCLHLSLSVLLTAGSGTILSGATAPGVPEDVRYKVDTLVEDLPQPMQLQIAPDGRIFFIEIGGKVKIHHPDTKQTVEAASIPVFTGQENGMLGMALDPDFAKNQWIYLLHSPQNFKGQHISRYVMKGDKLDTSSEKILLTFEEQRDQCCHHAGCLRFGPDGCLYFSTGDNTNPFESDGLAPIDQRPGRAPWDAEKSSANTNDLRGKINRIKPTPDGSYTIPPGNLFPPNAAKTRPEIYVMGCRNPWRFNFNAKTGTLYYGDVGNDAGGDSADRGPRGYDLINQVKKPANFGWPLFRGNNFPYANYDFANKKVGEKFDPLKPVNDSPNNTGLRILPPAQPGWIFYPAGASAEFPELGSGGRTACAGPVFNWKPEHEKTGGFPKYYDGCLLIYDWSRPFFKWVRLDASEKRLAIEPFSGAVRMLGEGAKAEPSGSFPLRRLVDMTFGPDGALYLLDYGSTWGANKDAKLVRISYQPGNRAPVAKAAAKPTAGREPFTVELSSAGTVDVDGDALSYEWHLMPEDKVLTKQATAKVTLTTPGDFVVELRVKDSKGATDIARLPLVVGNTPPEVRFESPQEHDFFTPGKPVAFKLSVKDAEDGSSADAGKADDLASRTVLTADWQRSDGKVDLPPGQARMKSSDCFACHAVETQIVGPPLVAIAEKYRGQDGAAAATIQRVLKGSTGVWGQVMMLPHPQHTADEVSMMVQWIFSLQKGAGGPAQLRGLSGEVQAPTDATVGAGTLEASYTDLGRAPASQLSAKVTVHLLSRRIEAEAGDAIDGGQPHDQDGASGKKSLKVSAAGSSLKFTSLNLSDSAGVTCRVASAPGGVIELRAGSRTGKVLATCEVKPTGGADKYVDVTAPLKTQTDRTDVVVVFKNGDKPTKGELMDIDWIQFNAP